MLILTARHRVGGRFHSPHRGGNASQDIEWLGPQRISMWLIVTTSIHAVAVTRSHRGGTHRWRTRCIRRDSLDQNTFG